MMELLTNRTVVVSGGARGMGEAIARRFHREGARVLIGDIRATEGEALAQDLGPNARFVHLDVRNEEDWEAVLQVAENDFGPVSVLANNAGVVHYKRISDEQPSEFQSVLDINVFGVWLGMRTLLPSLQRGGGGAIINTSSTAGMAGYEQLGSYVASKWAVRGLTKTAALEFARFAIRVFSIHPGPIRTAMTSQYDDSRVKGQPIQRFGDPAEVAALAWFLATEATYSTGSEFVIDGGLLTGSVRHREDSPDVDG